MVLTSEEINIIVFKYLQESGFRHTSFAFQYESQVDKSAYCDAQIQPGALINIIHKGLQFMEIEAHMNEDGELVDCSVPFSLLEPHHCAVTDDNFGTTATVLTKEHQTSPTTVTAAVTTTTTNKRQRKEDKKQKDREKRARKETTTNATVDEVMDITDNSTDQAPSTSITPTVNADAETATNNDTTTTDTAKRVANGDNDAKVVKSEQEDQEMKDVDQQQQQDDLEITSDKVTVLEGHQNEVFSCAWNPSVTSLLASGSGDATARLWQVPEGKEKVTDPIVLQHLPNMNDNKDVTTLDWNPTGTLLVTGSYDGQARIWTQKGQLRYVMGHHKGPIFSLKWNFNGDLILSGSADTTTIVWDPETGDMKQQFELHTLAILDIDWMDNTTFASCSSDKTIYVCKVGNRKPLKKWIGHDDEVNAVRWDPSGQYLASCSDDMTAQIWSLDSDEPLQVLKGHTLQIYTLQWAPTNSHNGERILATASFDATVRIWDAMNGTCLYTLKNHREAVYSISFSPDARLLASGSFDQLLNVWDVKAGTLKKAFKTNGGIFEVHFNKTGDKLAACTSNKQVVILNQMKSV